PGNSDGNADVEIHNCLIDSNQVTLELLSVDDLLITSCTFANDVIGADHVIHSGESFSLEDSILAEGPTSLFDATTSVDSVSFNLFDGTAVFPRGSSNSTFAAAGFVNAAAGDYHLQPTSPALDLVPASIGPNTLGNGLDL